MIKAQLADGQHTKKPNPITRGQKWRAGTGKDYSKKYHQKHKEARNTKERERYANNKEYTSFLHKMWYQENKARSAAQHREHRRKLRSEAMAGYGSRCLFCGEDRLAGLQFHHVNHDGKEQRESTIGSSSGYHKWIIDNHFPDSLILLCGTCHLILHEVERNDNC